jgi:tetrahydromethanopterin S-methyltransferase subunit A
MTENLTKEQVLDYQEQATLFARLINTWDADLIRLYLEQTRHQVDGTMDVILPHFMSITDMHKAQHNMRFLRSMGEHILAVQKLAQEFLQSEAA